MVFDADLFNSVNVDDSAFPEICTCEVENLSEMSLCFFFWEC